MGLGGSLGALVLLAACPGDDAPPVVDTDGTGSSGGGSQGTMSSVDDTSAGSSSDGADTGPVDCEFSPAADDISFDPGQVTVMTNNVARTAVIGGQVVTCGDVSVELGPADSDILLDAPCTGLADIDGVQGVAVTAAGTTVLFEVDGNGVVELDSLSDPMVRHEDVVAHEGAIFVASGTDGLSRFDVAGGALGPATAVPGATDARGLGSVAAGLLVADGAAGARLVDANGGGSITVLDLDPEGKIESPARRVVVDGDRAYVLRGVYGMSVVEVAGESLSLTANVETEGIAVDAAPAPGGVIVATGSSLARYSIGDGPEPILVSRQLQPNYGELNSLWFRTVVDSSGSLVASMGDEVVPLELGDGTPQPLIHVDRATYSFWADVGESTDSIVTIENRGAVPMVLADLAAGSFPLENLNLEERTGCPGQYTLEADARGLVQVTYADPVAEVLLTSFDATTDAADASMFSLRMEVNRATPEVDQPAAPFEVLDSNGNLIRMTDYEDRVVFIKVFNET